MPQKITVSTNSSQELVDITERVKDAVSGSGVDKGICLVYVPHATAAITINENADPNVSRDLLKALSDAVPHGGWMHDQVDNNGAAHIKASIIGPSESIPVEGGKLVLGTWQDIFLCEFDGPKEKRNVIVTVAPE